MLYQKITDLLLMLNLHSILLTSGSDIGHWILDCLSKYVKGQYNLIVDSITDLSNPGYIWLGLFILLKIIQKIYNYD